MSKALKTFAKQGEYTHAQVMPGNILKLYAIEECEVCECAVEAANSVNVAKMTQKDAERAGLVVGVAPEEGGWSDLHNASTCNDCCYKEEAKAA